MERIFTEMEKKQVEWTLVFQVLKTQQEESGQLSESVVSLTADETHIPPVLLVSKIVGWTVRSCHGSESGVISSVCRNDSLVLFIKTVLSLVVSDLQLRKELIESVNIGGTSNVINGEKIPPRVYFYEWNRGQCAVWDFKKWFSNSACDGCVCGVELNVELCQCVRREASPGWSTPAPSTWCLQGNPSWTATRLPSRTSPVIWWAAEGKKK